MLDKLCTKQTLSLQSEITKGFIKRADDTGMKRLVLDADLLIAF